MTQQNGRDGIKKESWYFCEPIRIKNNKKTEPSDTKRNRMIETQAEEQFSSQNWAKYKIIVELTLFNEIRLRYELDTKLVEWTLYNLGHTVKITKTKI